MFLDKNDFLIVNCKYFSIFFFFLVLFRTVVPILIALQNLQGNISQTLLNYELYRDLLKMQILVHCVAVTVE